MTARKPRSKKRTRRRSMPAWAIILIAIGSMITGGLIAAAAVLLYIGKGMWQ